MFRDREYLSTLLTIGLPIAIQNFIGSSLNAVGVLMIGQLGETSVAAVGLANQVFFLLTLVLFGVISGSAIFTAQFWGKQDLAGIRKVVGLCMGLALSVAALFTVLALGLPRQTLGVFSSDPAVIELGSQYLVIIGWSYMATAASFTFSGNLRATGNVRPPMVVSVVALGLGTALNYALIFGVWGLPKMGVEGAALGTCLARWLEFFAMTGVTYLRRMPTALYPSNLRGLSREFLRRYLVTVIPVTANEALWSVGITIYNMIYARVGTEAYAAVNIAATIENMAFVIFLGISNATAIMIGTRIGAGEEGKAYTYARRGLALGVGLALVMGLLLILVSGPVVGNYNISAEAAGNARAVMIVMGCVLWIKVSNMTFIAGILRSGGDTRMALVLDVASVWVVGIPLALLGAFVFNFPIYGVVAMVAGDEITKAIGGLWRFRSKRWINYLVGELK